jgi:Mce-associated membrane protein
MGLGSGRLRTGAAWLVAIVALLTGCTSDRGDGAPAPRPANLAFIYDEASKTVLNQMSPAVAGFFSYDYRHLDEHEVQLKAVSTDRFWSQLQPTLKILHEVAPRKQAAATATVVANSLHLLQPGRAELLLFVNRSTTEAAGRPQLAGSSVLVTAARRGSTWKIDGMTVL